MAEDLQFPCLAASDVSLLDLVLMTRDAMRFILNFPMMRIVVFLRCLHPLSSFSSIGGYSDSTGLLC